MLLEFIGAFFLGSVISGCRTKGQVSETVVLDTSTPAGIAFAKEYIHKKEIRESLLWQAGQDIYIEMREKAGYAKCDGSISTVHKQEPYQHSFDLSKPSLDLDDKQIL